MYVGFVALALWLPPPGGVPMAWDVGHARILAACYSIPASLLRAVGGWMSDRIGARRGRECTIGVVMFTVLVCVLASSYRWARRRSISTFRCSTRTMAWMHVAIRRMERRHFPQIDRETDPPEAIDAAAADRARGR